MVYLFLTGYPIGNMLPVFDVTENTIRSILKKVLLQFQKFKEYTLVPVDYVPQVIEIDEIYIKMQKKRKFYGWLTYDPKNKYVIDFVIGKRDDDTLEKLFKKLKRFRGKIKLVLIDGYQGYEKFISNYLVACTSTNSSALDKNIALRLFKQDSSSAEIFGTKVIVTNIKQVVINSVKKLFFDFVSLMFFVFFNTPLF